MTSQEAFLAGHCPMTGRYFEPCESRRLNESENCESRPCSISVLCLPYRGGGCGCSSSGSARYVYTLRFIGLIHGLDAWQQIRKKSKNNEPTDHSAEWSSFLTCI